MFGSHLKRDWRAKKCSSIKTMRRLTSRPLQWQNCELGYELIPHPPYSPDLIPYDYFLFPNLKTWLNGKKFSSNEEVILAVNEYFADFETAYFKWLPNMNYASFLAEIWPEGVRRGSFEMSRHQMDCSAISWKFIKLIKRPTYLHTKLDLNDHHSKLLCLKSRIAPLKTVSLSRLELSAALLLARLINKVRESLKLS